MEIRIKMDDLRGTHISENPHMYLYLVPYGEFPVRNSRFVTGVQAENPHGP